MVSLAQESQQEQGQRVPLGAGLEPGWVCNWGRQDARNQPGGEVRGGPAVPCLSLGPYPMPINESS